MCRLLIAVAATIGCHERSTSSDPGECVPERRISMSQFDADRCARSKAAPDASQVFAPLSIAPESKGNGSSGSK
jgi:hypothetical protein